MKDYSSFHKGIKNNIHNEIINSMFESQVVVGYANENNFDLTDKDNIKLLITNALINLKRIRRNNYIIYSLDMKVSKDTTFRYSKKITRLESIQGNYETIILKG